MADPIKLKRKKGFDAAKKLVQERFGALRLSMPDRPVTDDGEIIEPRVPHDLTILKDHELGRLYSEFSCMMQYAQASLGWIEAQRLLDKRAARMTRSEAKVLHTGKVALLEAMVDLEPKTRAKEHQATVSDAVAIITTAMFKSYEVGRDACSREMTRRIAAKELMGAEK